MADAERTEKASPKRLKDARERGQVARSRDLVTAVSSLAVTIALASEAPALVRKLGSNLIEALTRLGDRPLAAPTTGELGAVVVRDVWIVLLAVGPLLGIAGFAGLAGNVAQSGWVFSLEPLQWDWNRLSPSKGLARLKPSQSGVDLVKTVIAVTVLTVLAFKIGGELVAESPMLAWMAPADAAASGWGRLVRLLWQSAFAMLAIAGADFGVQFWRHRSSLKMSKQEQRDESRSADGNPEIKARVRKIQREMTRRRMLKAVRQATVVITNPTHYAVALEYRRERMAAPVVVAKGKDLVAARIKALAREHGVPVVENVSLAQGLYKGAEVGETIPGALFGAVAEVLAYLVRIKELML